MPLSGQRTSLKSQVLNAELNEYTHKNNTAISNSLSNYYDTNSSSKKRNIEKQQLVQNWNNGRPILLKLIQK
jgi:hypothetical protein